METINYSDKVFHTLKDIIHMQFTKANGIISLLLLSGEGIDRKTEYGALWAVSDYLEDLEKLFNKFSEQY